MLDYHVHLWPHELVAEPAELRLDRLRVYCERANANGVAEIALTEHLFRFKDVEGLLATQYRDEQNPELQAQMAGYFVHHATEELDHYVEAVLEAKAAGLPVVLGLEVDYYPGQDGRGRRTARRLPLRRAARLGALARRVDVRRA